MTAPTTTNQDNLITAEEFNRRVKQWGKEVERTSHGAVVRLTRAYSGALRDTLHSVVSFAREDGVAQWVGFRFPRHGVFVSYGVGRGWVRQGGTVVRARLVRRGSKEFNRYSEKGYERNAKLDIIVPLSSPAKKRVPKDWLDSNIDASIEKLGDIAGEYYGDESMRHVLEEFDRMRIVKKH